MSSIDERIVKMVFDNDKFEAGVKTTLDTLNKLKEKLTFSSKDTFKGIEVSANDVKFDGIASGVESLQKRFSTLGIVGMEITRRLTNAAIDAGKRISDATIGQIKSGGMTRALNIEQAKFQLEGLGMDVEKVMKNANDAVSGTAYGLDEAARAASVLGASGVKAGDEMTQVLTTISGAAAMTGRSYSDIADIFSTVAGNGRLMTEQLRQFSHSGLNVSAVLKEAFGKSEAEINEMVSKGEISFAQFTEAMSKFGKHAKAANDTYTGSLSNMKAALSRIGQLFASPYLENAKFVMHSLTNAINDVKLALEPLADYLDRKVMQVFRNYVTTMFDALTATDKFEDKTKAQGPIITLVRGLVNMFQILRGTLAQIGPAFKEVFPKATVDNFKKLIDRFHGWTDALFKNKKAIDNLHNAAKQVFKIIFAIVKLVGTLVKTVVKGINRITKPFGGMINLLSSIVGFVGKLVYGVITIITKVRLLSRVFTLVTTVIGGVLSAIVWLIKGIGSVISSIKQTKMVQSIISNISSVFKECSKVISGFIDRIKTVAKAISGRFSEALGAAGSWLRSVIWVVFLKLTEAVAKLAEKFKELFSSFKQSKAFMTIVNGFNSITSHIVNFADKIIGLGKAFATWFKDNKVLSKFIDILSTGLKLCIGVLIEAVEKVKEFATNLYDFLKETGLLEAFVELFHKGMDKVKSGLEIAREYANKFADFLETKVKSAMERTADKAEEFKWKLDKSFVVSAAKKGIGFLKALFDDLRVGLSLLYEGVKKIAPSVIGVFTNLADVIAQKMQGLVQFFGGLKFKDILEYFPQEAYGIFLLFFSRFVSRLGKAAEAFGGVASSIGGYFDAMTEKLKGGSKWQQRAKLLIMFAAGILILAKAVQMLGTMDIKDLGKGLGAVAIMMTLLVGSLIILGKALDKLNNQVNFAQVGLGMLLVSASLFIMAQAIKSFANLKWETFLKGFIMVAASLLLISEAINRMGNPEHMLGTAAGILVMTGALFVLAAAIKLFSKFKWSTYGKGMLLIAGGLLAIALAIRLMGNPEHMASTGVGILLMSVALLFMQKAIEKMGSLDIKTLAKGLISVVVLIFSLAAAVAIMGNGQNLNGAAKAIMKLAISLGIIAIAMKLLGTIQLGNLIAGIVGFVSILGAMTVALYVLSNISSGLDQAVLSILAVSAALAIIAIALKALGSVPYDNLFISLVGLIGLLGVITIALQGLSSTGGGKNMLLTAAAFVVMGAAIMVLALAIKQLASIPTDTLSSSLLALGLSLLALVGLGALAEVFAIGLLALGATLLAISTSVLIFAVGVDMLIGSLSALAELGPESMERVVEAIVALATGLAEHAGEIAMAGVTLIMAFLGALATGIPMLVSLGLQFIVSLLAGIAANIGQIANMALLIIAGLITGIARGIGIVIQAGIMLMAAFVIGLANGIRANSELLFAAVRSLLEAILEMVIDAFKMIAEMIPVVGDKISKGLDKAKEGLRETMKVDEADKMLDEGMTNIENTIDEHTGPIKDKFGEMKDGMVGGLDGLGDQLGGKGSDALNQLMGSMTDKIPGITDASGQIDLAALSGVENLPEEFQNMGFSSGAELAEALGSNTGSATANADKLATGALGPLRESEHEAAKSGKNVNKNYADNINPNAAVKSAAQVGEKSAKALEAAKVKAGTAGKAFTTEYKKGIESNKSQASTAGKSISNQAASGTNNQLAYNSANTAGLNLGQGLVNGLNAKKTAAYDAGYALGKAAADGQKAGAKERSPSKIAIQTGKYLGEGLIIGINSMISPAYKAGYNIGEKASNALTDAMSKVYDVLNSEIDSNPKITPVIDLTAAKKGVGQLDSMLSNKTISTAALAGRPAIGMMGFMPANSRQDTTNNNVTNTFNITVDGAENPEAFADRLLRQVNMKTRMGMA